MEHEATQEGKSVPDTVNSMCGGLEAREHLSCFRTERQARARQREEMVEDEAGGRGRSWATEDWKAIWSG